MNDKKKKALERFTDNISKLKIEQFCSLLDEDKIKLSDNFFDIKRNLNLNSNEEKYFLDITLNFLNHEDLILLIHQLIESKTEKNIHKENTVLVFSGPIKYHEKMDQTYSVLLKMINSATKSIILVGYAMIDKKNEELFESLKNAAKERNVTIKIIFDKATKSKKWGKWTKSPKKIISQVWGDLEHFPEIYTYDATKSSLHAKLLIIDDEEIFVTSANLTDRAMTRNLEIGIRHKGKVAKDATEILSLLIKKQIFTEINYD